jgi:hypothetical protein
MQINRHEVLERIRPNYKVLDIGSWYDVFPRANTIIDLMPYETRHNRHPREREGFTKDSWIIGDINKPEVWKNFADKEFDFAICSHLLEDIRDPLFVCEQLSRVAKAGYIECPSRFRECAKKSAYALYSGYDHHRWILDVIDGSLVFTAKLPWAHIFDYLGDHRRHYLNAYSFHFTGIFWESGIHCYERFPKGTEKESANLFYFYDNYDYEKAQFVFNLDLKKITPKAGLGSCVWIDKYKLPLEEAEPDVYDKYQNKVKQLTEKHRLLI